MRAVVVGSESDCRGGLGFGNNIKWPTIITGEFGQDVLDAAYTVIGDDTGVAWYAP